MMFLASAAFLLLYCVLIIISGSRAVGYRAHSRLNKAAWLSFVVSGILFGSAISAAWL